MNFTSKYSDQIRPVFRLLAVIISVPMILVGCLLIVEMVLEDKAGSQSLLKIAVPQIIFGILFFIGGVKGRLPTWMDSKDENLSTRATCAQGLIGPFLIVFLGILLYYVKLFSVIWWIILVYLIFLLIFGVINPKKYEEI